MGRFSAAQTVQTTTPTVPEKNPHVRRPFS